MNSEQKLEQARRTSKTLGYESGNQAVAEWLLQFEYFDRHLGEILNGYFSPKNPIAEALDLRAPSLKKRAKEGDVESYLRGKIEKQLPTLDTESESPEPQPTTIDESQNPE